MNSYAVHKIKIMNWSKICCARKMK